MTLRARLVLAFGYVLLFAVIALEVPLALNFSRRVDSEVRSEASTGAQAVAAAASGRLGARAALDDLVRRQARAGGGRVLVVTDERDPEVGATVSAAGACGLMARTSDERTVPDTLRRAAAGELILPATHLSALVDLVRVSKLGHRDGAIDALTRREREVLALLADGRTTQEVSEALSISVLTVQSHVKNVLAKLGVHSKVEAIRVAWRSGALTVPLGA